MLGNKGKSLLFLPIFLFFLIGGVYGFSTSQLTFNETFGTSVFSQNSCTNVGDNNFTYDNLKDASIVNFNSGNGNNYWRCARDGTQSLNIYAGGDGRYINTNYSARIDTGAVGCNGNCQSAFTYIFNESVYFFRSDVLQFYCGAIEEDTDGGDFLVFGSESQKSEVSFVLTDINGVDECAYSQRPSNCKHLYALTGQICNGSSSPGYVNVTFGQIMDNFSLTSADFQDIRFISFQHVGGVSVGFIDDIYMTYRDGTNYLPEYNLTYERSCHNSSTGIGYLNFNLSVSDPEGDQIYYAYDYRDSRFYNITIDYGEALYRDSIFSSYIYRPDGSYCNVSGYVGSTNLDFNEDDIQIDTAMVGIPGFFLDRLDTVTAMRISSDCSGKSEYIQKLPFQLYNLVYSTKITDFFTDGEEFNITGYNGLYDETFSVRFLVNSSNVSIYSHNGTAFNKAGEMEIRNWDDYYHLTIVSYANASKPVLYITDSTGDYTSLSYTLDSIASSSRTDYVGIGVSTGTIYQLEYSLSGIRPNIYWRTVRPNNLTVDSPGYYQMVIWVSDDNHYPDNYHEIFVGGNIHDCTYVPVIPVSTGGILGGGVFGDDNLKFRPFDILRHLLGDKLNSYLNAVEGTNRAGGAIWLIFTVVFFGLLIIQWKNGGSDITFPLFVSALFVFTSSFIIRYQAGIYGGLILMAIPFGMVLMRSFSDAAIGTPTEIPMAKDKPYRPGVRSGLDMIPKQRYRNYRSNVRPGFNRDFSQRRKPRPRPGFSNAVVYRPSEGSRARQYNRRWNNGK